MAWFEEHGSPFAGLCGGDDGIHGHMRLAPLASALNGVLSGLPFVVTGGPDPGAVDQEVQRASGAPIRDLDGQRLPPSAPRRINWHPPVQNGELQREATMPVVCPSGSSNRTSMVRHVGLRKATRAWPCPCPARSVVICACGARLRSRISSPYGNGRVSVDAYGPPGR